MRSGGLKREYPFQSPEKENLYSLIEQGDASKLESFLAFHQEKSPRSSPAVLTAAAHSAAKLGQLGCLQALYRFQAYCTKSICRAAAAGGSLTCLQFVHAQGCPWDASTAAAAAENGHAHVVRFLGDAGCPIDASVCRQAAAGGHLACLAAAREHNCPWDDTTLVAAIERGNLDCATYALDGGCPLSIDVSNAAAAGGHLSFLCRARGKIPLDESTLVAAAEARALPCLAYCIDAGCPMGPAVCEAAARAGDVACLELLHARGCPCDERVADAAIAGGNLACLRWAMDAGCALSLSVMLRAAASGSLAVVRFLHGRGVPLWDRAEAQRFSTDLDFRSDEGFVTPGTLYFPMRPREWGWFRNDSAQEFERTWEVLRYGALHGAPLTPEAAAFVEARRASAQEVFWCVSAAGTLSRRPGPHGSTWGAMGALPRDVIIKIVEVANLEIPDTFGC